MEYLTSSITSLSAAAASSLVNAIGEGMILATAVALCLHFLPGIKASVRFVIWLGVLFAVVPLHLLPSMQYGRGSSLPANVASLHLDARWSILIAGIWAVLSLTRAVRLVDSAIRLRRIAAAATQIVPDPACGSVWKNSRRSLEVCTSPAVDRPSVVGFFRPRILLPSDLLQKISSQELEQILLHETEHLRRRDDWTNLVQKIALILFPLNPVLLWVERRLCVERELACDDCVLNFTMSRKAYATCLTNLAEHSLLRRGVSLALGAWERQSELARRVHRILRKPEQTMGRVTTNVIAGFLMAGLLGGAVTLARSPQLVSFSSSSSDVHSDEPVAAAYKPVADSRNFSPTLVKAVMPEPQSNFAAHRTPMRRRPATVKTVHPLPKPRQQRWIVLTTWQTTSASPRSAMAVSQPTSSSYAAVPVGDSWLILQL